MDIQNYINRAKKSLFRFEALQDYNVAQESDALQMWRDSQKVDREYSQRWWNFIAEKTKQGVTMQHVRLVMLPATEYTRWEFAVYEFSAKYGDDIRVIDEAKFKKLKLSQHDFWLIDDEVALDMSYNKKGEYVDSKIAASPKPFLEAKQLLLQHSVPLKKFKLK